MKITVICKASMQIGLGHLIRTNSFINQVINSNNDIFFDYVLIGDENLKKLINNEKINVTFYENEYQIESIDNSEVLIVDMTQIDKEILKKIQSFADITAVFSPIFNHFEMVDYFFGRTKYLDFSPNKYSNLRIYSGLDYTIIQDNCKQISAGVFEENLKNKNFPIALSMGGGDASNKTLEVLKALKDSKINATFWVMLGEGYNHSFDSLVDEIRKNTRHEIILAKTNSSMWSILKNCVLCILPGGITSYEAVYAGLPTINFFESKSQEFLIREIIENNSAYNFGLYSHATLQKISKFIEQIYNNPKVLLQMHVNSKMLIDGNGAQRIFGILKNHFLGNGANEFKTILRRQVITN